MIYSKAVKRLKEYQDCIVLCRYIEKRPYGCYSGFKIGKIQEIKGSGILGTVFGDTWTHFGEDMHTNMSMDGIVDIRNHRGEALYRNKILETAWRPPQNLEDRVILLIYGVNLP